MSYPAIYEIKMVDGSRNEVREVVDIAIVSRTYVMTDKEGMIIFSAPLDAIMSVALA